MSKAPPPTLDINYPGLLFAHVCTWGRKWFLTVQRSADLEETDPRYAPVQEFLKVYNATLEDQSVFAEPDFIGGKTDVTIYRLAVP